MATTVNAGAVSAPGANIFCDWAPRLRLAGFGVLPVNGKRPLVSGFRAWRSAPTLSAISRWAVRHANANVVYIPGLSGLVVLDADDAEACHAIPRLFGDTPGKVRTRRGTHYLYRHDGADLGIACKPEGLWPQRRSQARPLHRRGTSECPRKRARLHLHVDRLRRDRHRSSARP